MSHNLEIDGFVGDLTWKEMGMMFDADFTEKIYQTVLTNLVEHSSDLNIYFNDMNKNDILKYYYFYTLVQNGSRLDLKNNPDWDTSYFVFDGDVYRRDGTGNIAYGIAGEIVGIPKPILFWAAGYAQNKSGNSGSEYYFGDDPYDQLCIQIGYEYSSRRDK